jgi:murein DD-endopeptidase MepM/ murein hydrolase activator NlpD
MVNKLPEQPEYTIPTDPTQQQEVTATGTRAPQPPKWQGITQNEEQYNFLKGVAQELPNVYKTGNFRQLQDVIDAGIGYRSGLYQYGNRSGFNSNTQVRDHILSQARKVAKAEGIQGFSSQAQYSGTSIKGVPYSSILKDLRRKASDRVLGSEFGRLGIEARAIQELQKRQAKQQGEVRQFRSLDDVAGRTYTVLLPSGRERTFKVKGFEKKDKYIYADGSVRSKSSYRHGKEKAVKRVAEYYFTYDNEKGDTRRTNADWLLQTIGAQMQSLPQDFLDYAQARNKDLSSYYGGTVGDVQTASGYQSGPSSYVDSSGKQIIGRGDEGFASYSKKAEAAGHSERLKEQQPERWVNDTEDMRNIAMADLQGTTGVTLFKMPNGQTGFFDPKQRSVLLVPESELSKYGDIQQLSNQQLQSMGIAGRSSRTGTAQDLEGYVNNAIEQSFVIPEQGRRARELNIMQGNEVDYLQNQDFSANMVGAQQDGVQVQMAAFTGGDGETQTAPSGASVNSSTGMLTLSSGQKISPQDPNYQAYLDQEGLQLPSGATQPSGQQLATGQAQTYIADQDAAQRVEEQRAVLGNQPASTDLIQDTFAAYHGREATAQELARYAAMGAEQSVQEIIGGAPQPYSAEEHQLISSGDFERIESPEELANLAGIDESQIIRIGNKMFKPAALSVTVDDVVDGNSLTGKEPVDVSAGEMRGSDYTDAEITETANDIKDQAYNAIDPKFEETRKAYWDSLLLQTDFREKTLGDLEDEYEIDRLSSELAALDKEIAAEEAAWRKLEVENRNQPISITAIVGREAHIKRMANMRTQELLAIRDAKLGDIERAEKRIAQMYDAMVGDHNENIEHLKDWYNEQKEFFTRDEQRAYEQKIKDEERAYEQYQADKATVSALMIELAKAGVSSDIRFTDSVEDAISKFGDAMQSVDYGFDEKYLTADYKEFVAEGGTPGDSEAYRRWKAEKKALEDAADLGYTAEDIENAKFQSNKIISLTNDLASISAEDLSRFVGSKLANVQPMPGITPDDYNDFHATYSQLRNMLTLDNLDLMSGVLSETDVKILADAASALSLATSPERFLQELNTIQTEAYGDLLNLGVKEQQLYGTDTGAGGYDSIWGFNPDLNTSLNYSPEQLNSLTNGQTSLATMGSGSITGIDGSKYWSHGLDVVFDGGDKYGKGAPVNAPFDGKIIATRTNSYPGEEKSFGNQVKIQRSDGTEVWISHLDEVNPLSIGSYVKAGQIIGTQGNTGSTYSTSGGDGTHTDITMVRPDGSYYTSREVAALLGDVRLTNLV